MKNLIAAAGILLLLGAGCSVQSGNEGASGSLDLNAGANAY